VAERRGHWTVDTDFTLHPGFLEVGALTTTNEVFIPLLTAPKDIMPRTDVSTADERGHAFPLGGTYRGRLAASMMLIWLAERAALLGDVVAMLAALTDTDTRVSAEAFDALEDIIDTKRDPCAWKPSPASTSCDPRSQPRNALVDFANAARLFTRSVVVLAAFPKTAAFGESHKLATVTYDGPIRWTKPRLISWKTPRLARETFGSQPLRIAPLTVFGGDAESYHVQLNPPDGVTVVDSRLLYSYTAQRPITGSYSARYGDFPDQGLAPTPEPSRPPSCRDDALHSELEDYTLVAARPLPPASAAQGWRRYWGFVLGSSEPMPAHVRVGGQRLPRLIDGRDVITMFHVYPNMPAFVGLRVAAAMNFAYVAGLFAAWVAHDWSDLALKYRPEPIFLLGVLVAGFGSGLALYRKEHILTTAVAAPWRRLFVAQLVAVLGSMIAMVPSIGHSGIDVGTKYAVIAMFGLGLASLITLSVISWRAEKAQKTGINFVKRAQGYYLRRIRFSKGRVPDVVYANNLRARSEIADDPSGQAETNATMEDLARRYLGEVNRRRLFNEGIPPTSRHEPRARGSSGGASASSF
jgi:hypothetical protein